MKFTFLILFFTLNTCLAKYNLTDQQRFFLEELRDAQFVQLYYAYNYPKSIAVYNELKVYSKMKYQFIFAQTFNWGQAHNWGLIIIDFSTLHKSKPILAFVLSQEWAHQALGHLDNFYHPTRSAWQYSSTQKSKEDASDVCARKFRAQYGCTIDIVTNYSYNLPLMTDHTQSSRKERAEKVKSGFYSVTYEIRYQTTLVKCQHLKHSYYVTSCVHLANLQDDVTSCVHTCNHPYYGTYITCHLNGHLIQCKHTLLNGDKINCTHLVHPSGDVIRVSR